MIPDLVSTIVPVHNRPALLQEAVSSVLAQTWRPIEVIVVDDGSTDETPAVAAELARENPGVVHHIRIENAGPGPAREAGRQMAGGEFLQYLDSDDRLLPEKFAIQVDALCKHPECGIAYGMTRLVDGEGRTLQAPFKWTGERIPHLFPKLLVDRWWNTHTPLYRREITDRAGPWTDLRYSEDWEYDARIGAMKVELAFCDAYVSETRQHGEQRQTGGDKWLSPKDQVRFFRLLFGHACDADVPPASPEMTHFSRWAFHRARQCGLAGDAEAARACIEIALAAAEKTSADIAIYRGMASVFGWKQMGRLASRLEALRRRPAGGRTLAQPSALNSS